MNPLILLVIIYNIFYMHSLIAVDRFPAITPYCTGRLQVDAVHEIYWEESGNPAGVPVLFLHGGPGVGTQESDRTFFDPRFYRMILFDQRGCGKSIPRGCLTNNTTWDLVEDINKLRELLSIDRCLLFGGSWGSTLALAYAIKYPENVSGLILRGIFLCRQQELDWFYKEGANHLSPQAWQIFINGIPDEKRSDLLAVYHDQLHSDSHWTQMHAAAAWVLWEFANLQSTPDSRLNALLNSPFLFSAFAILFADQNKTQARIENHYFLNKGFFETDNWILENMHKIQNIPGIIIQGERDQICPWENAAELHLHWPASTFTLVPNAGHASSESGILEALIHATEEFKTKFLLHHFNSPLYPTENMIEDDIVKSLEFWNVPGAAIAIVKDNEIIMAKGFGYTKLEKVKSNEVNADTLFPIASLTKSFSAVATGIFADQQHISLDSTIQSLWPSFKLLDAYATRHLTLRDCLSMRAGLTGKPFEDNWWNQSHLTEKMLIEDLSQLSFPCGFRGCFAYQNLLYNIIGHTIETNTGKDWGLFVKQYLLNELKMHATTSDHAAFLASQNKAFPHQWVGNNIKEVPFERLDVIEAAAGLSSNADDMAKWLQFLLGKDHNFSSIIKSTLTPHTLAQPEMFFSKEEVWMKKVFFPQSHFLTYGMGWFIHDYKGMVICQAPGLTDGMNSLMALIPELDLGIVILNNLEAPFFSHSVLFHLIDHYRGEMSDWDPLLLDILTAGKGKVAE